MEPSYKTLQVVGSDGFIEKKSRFIGQASPAQTEREALDFLAEIRAKHPDASHNVYAYIIGRNAGIMRYSDAGEPSGTAGIPVLSVMRAQGVVDCCVVVTRFFGGVLLGAGGLARAYGQGAKLALSAAKVVIMEESARLLLGVDYPLWGRVEHALLTAPVRREGVEFGQTVTATLIVRTRDLEAVEATLTRVTDGRAVLLTMETFFAGWQTEGGENGENGGNEGGLCPP